MSSHSLLWHLIYCGKRTLENDTENGKHRRGKRGSRLSNRNHISIPDTDYRSPPEHAEEGDEDILPDLAHTELDQFGLDRDEVDEEEDIPDGHLDLQQRGTDHAPARSKLSSIVKTLLSQNSFRNPNSISFDNADSTTGLTESGEHSSSLPASSLLSSRSPSAFGLYSIINIAYLTTAPAKNVFIATGEVLQIGFTRKNIFKGFIWSLAITTMHYAGIIALSIPSGYCTFNYGLVALPGIISWVVCVVGCILMSHMETHPGKQILFSIAATTGVAGMHFTGK